MALSLLDSYAVEDVEFPAVVPDCLPVGVDSSFQLGKGVRLPILNSGQDEFLDL